MLIQEKWENQRAVEGKSKKSNGSTEEGIENRREFI